MMAAGATQAGMPLAELLAGLGDAPLPPLTVGGLCADSREVAPGDLFLACRGLRVHGLESARQAVSRGALAVAWEPEGCEDPGSLLAGLGVPVIAVPQLSRRLGIIADRFHGHPSEHMHVVGVTGTDGKTTVSHFVAQALSSPAAPAGLLGTLGYGVYGDLSAPTHTTPDALRLQAELAALRERGVTRLAMEVSSHALHQYRSEGIRFDTAVLTLLSRDHLDYHGTLEAYADAKRRLFESPGLACAVLNAGDAFGRELGAALGSRLRVISWQSDARARPLSGEWLRLRKVDPLPRGIALDIETDQGAVAFEAGVLGDFNAGNLLAAMGALRAAGFTLEQAAQRLAGVSTVPGRMELFSAPGKPAVVVDFAHTPHALDTVLKALRPHCRGRLLCVFGAGGDRDTGKRGPMGAAAERGADRVIVTSDNPRHESPGAIIEQIVAGMARPQQALCIEDRGEAIDSALSAAGPEDLVLVAGKGHETTQQVGDLKLPFSDRERVARWLRGGGA